MKNLIAALILLVIILLGCNEEIPLKNNSFSDNSFISKLVGMGFRSDMIVEYDDYFIVEGDLYFSKKELASEVYKTEQARSTYLVSTTMIRDIKVKIDQSMPTSGDDNWRTEISRSLSDWNAVNYNIASFRLLADNSSEIPDITIKSDGNQLENYELASAGFPTIDGKTYNTVKINLDYNDNQILSSTAKEYTLVHELGHCIGFRHTNWSILPQPESYAENIYGTTVNDGNSVMNGGKAGYEWNGFSDWDKMALQTLYPTYLVLENPVWTNIQGMTNIVDYIYLVQNSRFYRVSKTDGSYIQLGGAVWAGTEAITSYSGYVYIVENSRLYKVNPNDGSYLQIGGVVWPGTEAMSSLGSNLYIIQNGRLYRVNPNDGGYSQLGNAVWYGTTDMTTYNNYLYLVQNNRLYKVNPNDGNYFQLGGSVWANTYAISSLDQKLYIAENERSYEVEPSDGSYTQITGVVWGNTYDMTSIGPNLYIGQNSRIHKQPIEIER